MLTVVKLIISAGLIYLVNEIVIAKSRPFLGSLIASLPLVSMITFLWIYWDPRNEPEARIEKLANHSTGVFWFVLPSLPMFLIFPWLIRRGIAFWPTMLICCAITMVLYAMVYFILKRFGISV